jgi:hypothetical protein
MPFNDSSCDTMPHAHRISEHPPSTRRRKLVEAPSLTLQVIFFVLPVDLHKHPNVVFPVIENLFYRIFFPAERLLCPLGGFLRLFLRRNITI